MLERMLRTGPGRRLTTACALILLATAYILVFVDLPISVARSEAVIEREYDARPLIINVPGIWAEADLPPPTDPPLP